ncbi:MAG: hypothetical protein ACNA8W_08145 [Bradymonadaceae bacterium]
MLRRLTYIAPLLAIISLAVMSLSKDSQAHDVDPLRTVIVQVEVDRIDVMILFEEPAGARASLLLAKYDADQNGQIDGAEAELAGREMLPRMLAGLQFEVAGEQPRTAAPEIKFQTTPARGITAAAFVSYALPALESDKERTIHVRNLREKHGLPAEVLIRAGRDLRIASSTIPSTGGLATQPHSLTPGSDASAVIAHIEQGSTEVSKN